MAKANRGNFWEGCRALWDGGLFVLRTPGVRVFSLVPAALLLVVPPTLMVVLVLLAPSVAPEGDGGLAVAVRWSLRFFGAFLGFLGGVGLAYGLSGPALERLSAAIDRAAGLPEVPPEPWVATVRRSLGVALAGILVASVSEGCLVAVEAVLPPLAVVTLPLGAVAAAMVLLWEVFDVPMERRGMNANTRLAWFEKNWRRCAGFACALAVLILLPVIDLLFLPAAIAGATMLLREVPLDEGAPEEGASGGLSR